MALKTKSFITTLINSGADANLNLFTATFRPLGLKAKGTEVENAFSCRITNVSNLLQRNNTTVDIPYQNVTIPKVSSGSSIPKTLSFQIRLDDKYYVLDNLRQLQCIDTFGNVTIDDTKKINIIIEALKPPTISSEYSRINESNGLETFYTQYKWIFKSCYIISVSPLNYDYGSSSTGTVTVSFIWKEYEESVENAQETGENMLATQEEALARLQQWREEQATKKNKNINKAKSLFSDIASIGNTSKPNLELNIKTETYTGNATSKNSIFNTKTDTTVTSVTSNSITKVSSGSLDNSVKITKTTNLNTDVVNSFNELSSKKATDTTNTFTKESLLSYNPTKVSLPSKSPTDEVYPNYATDKNFNAIQKSEDIRTSSLKVISPTLTLKDINSSTTSKTLQSVTPFTEKNSTSNVLKTVKVDLTTTTTKEPMLLSKNGFNTTQDVTDSKGNVIGQMGISVGEYTVKTVFDNLTKKTTTYKELTEGYLGDNKSKSKTIYYDNYGNKVDSLEALKNKSSFKTITTPSVKTSKNTNS